MPKKILVIDDDPKMLVLEKTILVQRSAMTQGFSSGAVVFMNKPFSAKKFLTVVQTIIR